MINTPIVIKDFKSPVDTTRKQLLDEGNSKILGKKGFVFSNYMTEKQRIVLKIYLTLLNRKNY